VLNYQESALLRFIARRRGLKTHTPGHIDESTFGTPTLRKANAGSDVPRGAPYFVRGWAVDLGRKQTPWDIRVEIDRKEVPARICLRLPRPDVAALFATSDVLLSGFNAFVETASLAVGPHELTIRAVVGRYGTAFARIPATKRFHILNQYAAAISPPAHLVCTAGTYLLGPVPIVAYGDTLELSGWGLDDRGRPFASIAARIDDCLWFEGWTGIGYSEGEGEAAGFRVRIRLDVVAAGRHEVQVAGKMRDGRWRALGERRQLTVANPSEPISPWAHLLADGGDAIIAGEDGNALTRIEVSRVEPAFAFSGILRRRIPIGKSASLVARNSAGGEFALPNWSAPASDPNVILFGGKIDPRALAPARYRLFVESPDASQRYVGRADTGCDLVVQRADVRRLRRQPMPDGVQ